MNVYQPPTFDSPIDLDLSRNEGRPIITRIDLDPAIVPALTSRYPDTTNLTRLVAARHGVDPERVMVTAGADDALFRCLLRCGGSVVTTNPTFEMVRRYSNQIGLDLTEVDWWEGDLPVGELLDTAADMAVIVSPNNPTGSVISDADLRKLADRFETVVLDAAYAEFADEDLTGVGLELDNVIVLRTLSKAFGLAGLRVGYALGSPDVIAELTAFGSPYSVSALSAKLAETVLESATEQAERFASVIAGERTRLFEVLDDLHAGPLPSRANFVLATNVDPDWVVPAAASLGVGLRRFPDHRDLAKSVRIGLPGDPEGFQRLTQVLRTVLAPEAILFDMDGVLADVRQSFRAAIVATAARFGVEVTTDDIAAAKASGHASDDWELTRRLCVAAGVEVSFDEVKARFEQIYQGEGSAKGLKEKDRLLADRDRLESWAAMMPLGVVTARPRKDANEFLERFDLAGYFSTVVTREDAPPKPDPDPVTVACARLGVKRAWMLGDTPDDLRAARLAGVVPIAVVVPGDDKSAVSDAARILESVDQLQEVFDATNR
ncbi:MAG TPA: aminotransferase class I/II-fold pyridoxal phosphate-dependent enzyme [Acidimicrobiia bacterium]|jgi:histidinol-phosphate aminotransferase|nr:aminotransferase class I/II-fold pyridoxal phosphate-dependent enzyme [Acidimicrobiia bacterium]